MAVLIRMPTVWRLNPFTNDVLGLSCAELLARCPSVLNQDLLKSLMVRAEAGYLTGLRKAKGHFDED